MSKKFTHFGRICVTYVLVLALVFSFVMSSFVGLNIIASAETSSPNPSVFDLWEGDKPTSLDGLNMNGLGTKASPYEVTNPDQLWFAVNNTDETKYFKVMNDININDASNFDTWTDTNPDGVYDWNPNGIFAGNFDGNNKTITGLYASTSDNVFLGLFSRLGTNATIYNVIVDRAYFKSSNSSMTMVGGIAGGSVKGDNVYLFGCVVKNSKIIAYGSSYECGAGGIIGGVYENDSANSYRLTVTNCVAVDNELGSAKWKAGIIGANWGTYITLSNCYTTTYSIAHQLSGVTSVANYTTADATKPFDQDSNVFGDTSKVYQVAKNNMMGLTALDATNMSLLKSSEWILSEDNYPMPKAYRDVFTFLESDKDIASTSFADGDGTKNNPYQITNAAQLYKAVNNTEAGLYFKVMNDIIVNDASNFDAWTKDESFVDWTPTATTTKFTGNFDGNQCTIYGLYCSGAYPDLGLFPQVDSNANIYDVFVENAFFYSTAGSTRIGGLVGRANKTTNVSIYGCVVKNSKFAATYINNNYNENSVAGIIGASYGTSSSPNSVTIENCYAVDNTFLDANKGLWSAGFIGAYWSGTLNINNCFTDDVFGHKRDAATHTNCYTSADDPFNSDSYTFEQTTGKVNQLTEAQMKGEAAITNMNLDPIAWTSVENDYPLPVKYSVLYAFTAADKDFEATAYAGGTGTRNDPFKITNAPQLFKAVNNTDASKYFKVMNDITINNIANFDTWSNSSAFVDWDPSNTFAGTFDGNQKTIYGLYSSSTNKNLGLFSSVADNTFIYDVIIDHAYVAQTGSASMNMTAALVGSASGKDNVRLYGCIVKNSVIKGKSGAAAFIGGAYLNSGETYPTITLTSCYAVDNTITGASWPAGLIGARWGKQKSVITDCFVTDIHLEHQSQSATVTNCYVSGNVDKPFFNSSDAFQDGKVEKIDNTDMKGAEALTNMNLDSFGWTAVPEDYPMPKPYAAVAGGFIAADKDMAAVVFEEAGTLEDPYQITNAAELWKAVHNTDATKHFKVMNDITINDVSGFADWHNDLSYEDWNPDTSTKFVGTFNGNQKVITGLYGTGSYKYLGLFGRLGDNALIYDVIVDHAYFRTTAGGMSAVGGLVGTAHNTNGVYIYGCIVKNSKILNSHTGDAGEGGLVGAAFATVSTPCKITLENCYAVDNTLNGTCNWSSGLMAARWTSKSEMINCFTTDYALEHQSLSATATNCYVSGNVEYPFSHNDTAAFGETTGVYKIDNADMKGDLALENMKFSSTTWTIVADNYPMPKPYVLEKDAWVQGEPVTSFAQLEGDGTKESPYLITNGDELWFAVNNTSKIGAANDKIPYFRLENDIKLNQLANYKNWGTEAPANEWLPNGAFVGHFNGNYKTISGLYAAPTTETSAGLFAAIASDSSVNNLTLNKSYIKATAGTNLTVVGGIVGMVNGEANVELSGLVVKNSVLEGRGTTGGIVGLIANSNGAVVVERSYAVDNTISDITVAAAGLVGNVASNEDNTVVVSHSFTTSNYICRRADNAIFNNVYTTVDIAKPFVDDATAFGDSVKAIPLAKMKGDSAITNMALNAGYWENVADSYPVVKPYVDPNNFSADGKTLTVADLTKGSGTQNDPYQITNAAELWAAVNNTDPSLYFKVMNDITVNNTDEFAAWDDNSAMENWNPTETFVGVFDGDKYVISGLFAASSTDKRLGLFKQLGNEARLVDVIVDKAYFCYNGSAPQTFVGGLVGLVYGASDVAVYGCVVKNSKILNRYAGGAGEGGLIGGAYSPSSSVGDITLVNCYAVDNTQLGVCTWSSGLMAARWTTRSTMIDCFTTNYSLEHQSSNASATNCYVSGDVEYPFTLDTSAKFGDKGVYKIDNAKMKGADALTNMNFSTENWKATDSYPESMYELVINEGTVGEVWSGDAARTFAGGDGTEGNPWQVDTPERFVKMISSYGTSEHWFVLTADIKLNDTTAADWYNSDSVKPWINGKKFIGHIDGKGHTVTGLYINHNSSYGSGAGLIPQAGGNATITNINIDKCYVKGDTTKESYTGALVGYVGSGLVRIAGCNVSNVLVDKCNRFGGILGAGSTAVVTIDYCTFQGQKIADNYGTKMIGGIVGDSWGTTIASNCISKGIAAIGKAATAMSAVYSDVSQSESYSNKLNTILLNTEDMLGNAAKTNMDELNWKYFTTNADGIPTADNLHNPVDLSTAATMGTPGKVWSGFMAPAYAGGTGTVGDPYLISTPEQLYRFTLDTKVSLKKADKPAYVKITHDIYLNDVSDKNWKEKDNLNNWLGSGSLSSPFVGHLDGAYHVIYGMYSDQNTEGNACAIIPSANEGCTISRLGFSEGYMMNEATNEAYTAAFVGFISAKGKQGVTMEDGTYNPITFTECFVDDTFEVYSYYAGGFVGGTPMGVNFVDCFSNVYVGDGAKYSGAFIGNAFDKRYYDSFRNCYAFPASKWTSLSSIHAITDAETGGLKNVIENTYYFGSSNKYFEVVFYKYMFGDLAKTNMPGLDFDNIWMTVDGASPVLRHFANAEDFASSRDVSTTVKFVSGTDEIMLPDMEGFALTTMTLPLPEREGYFFGGWYVYEEGACEYDYGVFPVTDTTLYAKWNANSVTQNFENYVNTKYDYDEDYVYYRPGVAGYSSMKVHGGGKAMFRKGESDKEQDVILNATEPIAVGEEYRINFWVATEQADTKATISLVHYTWPDFQDPNLGVEKMVEVESLEVGEWTSYTYKFKASTPWVGIRTSGNAQLYMDDFFITPVDEFMKDASKVNDYDYFYNLGETDTNTTAQTLSGVRQTPVKTLAPSSAVSTEDTNNTIAFLVTVILAASALVVLSRVYLEDTKQEIENDIEE